MNAARDHGVLAVAIQHASSQPAGSVAHLDGLLISQSRIVVGLFVVRTCETSVARGQASALLRNISSGSPSW
jgi:hypothetical protein